MKSLIILLFILVAHNGFSQATLHPRDSVISGNSVAVYRVLLFDQETRGMMSADERDNLSLMGGVEVMEYSCLGRSYWSKSFKTRAEAKKALSSYKGLGFKNMRIVAFNR